MKLISAQFDLQTSWFLNVMDGISNEESLKQIHPDLNAVFWIAGHLTDARMTINSLISGTSVVSSYKKHFGKGTSANWTEEMPSLEQIKKDWLVISETLRETLANLNENQLNNTAPFQTSIPNTTLGGLIAYFAMHESFHLGQLSVLRKELGKPALLMTRSN